MERKKLYKYSGIKLAVDFDGTLTKGNYFPEIPEELPLAFEWLKNFRKEGGKVYLNTMRSNKDGKLKEAIDWCKERGLEFDSIGPHRSQFAWTASSKVYAHGYIDDAAYGTPILMAENNTPYVDWEKLIPEIEYRISLL